MALATWLLGAFGTHSITAQEPPPARAVSPELFGRASGLDLPPALESPRPPIARPGTVSEAPVDHLADDVTLPPAPLDPSDVRYPINLATALRLADARPLVVAATQASVWVAEAELTRAKLLWVPTLNLGFDYIRHDGGGPDFNKGVLTAPSVNFFYAGGALWGTISASDAIFQPLVARQTLNAANWDVQAAKNDAVLRVTDAYFRVHEHRGNFAGYLYCVGRGRDLADHIEQLSSELVPKVEVERARNMLAELELRATRERRQWRVASADLTEVLRLDPRAVVVPLEHDHVQLTLIDPGRPLDELMPIALTNRPELASHQAMVRAMTEGIRREKWRPLLPNIHLNGFQTPYEMIQAGIFGLGPNSSLNQWTGRVDFSVQPLWQLEGMGIGNLARIKGQRGMESAATIEFFKAQDGVAADVTRAQARLQAAAAQVYQADRTLRTAIVTFNGTFEGLQQTSRLGTVLVLINRPQEAVFALQLMGEAFEEYFRTVAEYNRAQFELFHALGYPASEVSVLMPPGEVLPVDTSRPSFLPPVGNGPPPATR
jgi:outer membrane protein TolC